MYIYTYIIYRRLGGRDQAGNRFVSFMRARASVCKVRMYLKNHRPSLFPFTLEGFLPFSLGRSGVPFPLRSMRSRKSKWDQVSPSESKWEQVSPSEFKWDPLNPSESKWNQMSPSEIEWDEVSLSESKWDRVSPSEISPSDSKWDQVNSSEIN